MNKHSTLKTSGSLLERAAELYGFEVPTARAAVQPRPEPEVRALEPTRLPEPQPQPLVEPELQRAPPAEAKGRPLRRARSAPRTNSIDRGRLQERGFISPDAPVGGLAEEFRIVKRQLLLGTNVAGRLPEEKRRTILLCSAHPNEGKTFCALNLALSLAGERDVEVLLVDADFPKPEILSILDLEGGKGFVDAIADPELDPESLVVRTDIRGLSILPAGRLVNNVTELLASERMKEVLQRLTLDQPKRILIFDSPPALAASPATVLASHAGQLVMVVRADQTTEADLREAVGLLSGCETVSLLLNGTGFAASGRRFGSYYGYGQ